MAVRLKGMSTTSSAASVPNAVSKPILKSLSNEYFHLGYCDSPSHKDFVCKEIERATR